MGIVHKMAVQFGYEGREAEMLTELEAALAAAQAGHPGAPAVVDASPTPAPVDPAGHQE